MQVVGYNSLIGPAANAGTVYGISFTNLNPDWLIPLRFVWHALINLILGINPKIKTPNSLRHQSIPIIKIIIIPPICWF